MDCPRVSRLLTSACLLGALASAEAAPAQKWPFTFDPAIAGDPTSVQQKLAAGDASYPDLPVSELTTLQSDQVTLYFFPEIAGLLESARVSATAASMTWPTTTTMCTAHAAFSIPTLLGPSPSTTCINADAAIRQRLADIGACLDVEQPERFALGFAPSQARASTGSIETMIGQAGEAWTHAAAPQMGLLPADFVPTLRSALAKIRRTTLSQRLATAQTAYTQALTVATNNASCFDASAQAALVTAISAIQNELAAAKNYLDGLESAGLAAANQEQVCLAAKSRVRKPLSYPSLTRPEREFLAMWLGGTYWRMRGGGLIPLGSTQDARWYFLHEAFTQIGRMVGGDDGANVAFQLYLPIFEGWGDWMDMGTTPGGADRYDDLLSMTARGERQVNPAADWLDQRSYESLDLTVGGLSMGPCYFRSYYPLGDFRYAAQLLPSPPYSDGISGPNPLGEQCTGAAIGLGLARVMLDGVPNGQPPVNLCAGKACGDDGCGGTCGSCGDGMTCSAGTCVACMPACAGKVCGEDDGCGGTCGGCDGDSPSDDDPSSSSSGCGCGAAGSSPAELAFMMLASVLTWTFGVRRRRTRPTA